MELANALRTIITFARTTHFAATQRGASLVEYALLIAFIALVCFAAVAFFGGQLNAKFSNIGGSIT